MNVEQTEASDVVSSKARCLTKDAERLVMAIPTFLDVIKRDFMTAHPKRAAVSPSKSLHEQEYGSAMTTGVGQPAGLWSTTEGGAAENLTTGQVV